ncbi:MAG: hemerythrin family protein [Deltaproteobacteria bacterium]|nr:hemerythrin family protein [Deltaproteobacteria bacterium]
MSLFTWSDDYSVEVNSMDSQHRKLFDLINELHGAMSEGKAGDVMSKVVSNLLDYTNTHFRDEEKMLEKVNYAELAKQKEQHKIFTDKVEEIKVGIEASSISAPLQTMSFLKDWLANHIKGEDKKYSSHVN